MDICTDLNSMCYFDKSVLTIGAFDGMHCGHMEIIKELKLRSETNNIPSIVITFDPHPKSILRSEYDDIWELLMCTDKKLEIFENFYTINTKGFYMPRERSIDIDTKFDFQIAEELLKFHST